MYWQHHIKLQLLLSTFVISITFFSCNENQPPLVHDDVEETVLALERQALDQWSQGNPLGFASNFADDATYFDDIGAQNGIDGKEEALDYFAALEGNIPPHDYELINPKVQVYGDIAVLTLHYHSTFDTVQGPPWKATAVYHFRDTTWQVVHANWSLVK